MATATAEDHVQSALRGGRHIFGLAIAFSFLCNLLRLTGPLFILLVYDRVLSSGSEETLVVLFSLVVAFLITMGMVDYARRRLLARFGAQFQERLEEELFRTSAKEQFFKTTQVKPVAGLSDIDAVRGFFHSNAIIAVLDVLWAPIFLGVVFIFHWILGCVVIVGVALLAGLYSLRTSAAAGYSEQASNSSKAIGGLKDMIRASRHELKTQSMTASFNNRWLRARQASRDSSIGLKDRTAWFSILSRQIKMLLQYSVLAMGAYLTLTGRATPGVMFTCMFLSVRVFTPVEQFLRELPGIRRVMANWKFLQKSFASRKPALEHRELWHLDPSLTLTNVATRSATTGQLILRSVNLSAEPGSTVSIVGKSGSGKTVLADTILGALPKAAGTISVGGANIERLSLDQARDIFAYIPESVRLVQGSIEENICGLSTEPDVDRVIKAARKVGLHDLLLTLPDGYQTRIEPGYDGLAEGQRQQIALARALYRQAKILIIDEPGAVLEEVLSGDIRTVLDNPDAVIIVLSRAPIPGFRADKEYVLENGRLKVSKGTKNVVPIENRNRSRPSKNRTGD